MKTSRILSSITLDVFLILVISPSHRDNELIKVRCWFLSKKWANILPLAFWGFTSFSINSLPKWQLLSIWRTIPTPAISALATSLSRNCQNFCFLSWQSPSWGPYAFRIRTGTSSAQTSTVSASMSSSPWETQTDLRSLFTLIQSPPPLLFFLCNS